MRKLIVTTIVLMIILSVAVVSNAASSQDIINYAKRTHNVGGESLTASAGEIVKIERYFEENPISEADGDTVIAKLDAIKEVMNDAGISDPTKLSQADKDKVTALANEAADAAGVKLSYSVSSKTLSIYDKNGELVESVGVTDNGKLAYTGNTDNSGNLLVNGTVTLISIFAIGAVILLIRGAFKNAKKA